MTYPNRNCTRGGRLHRTASVRHSQSTISARSAEEQPVHQDQPLHQDQPSQQDQPPHQNQPAHQDQQVQQPQQSTNMARFGAPNQADDSPTSTPLITSSSIFSLNSIRSTPCPGRGLYPQGPITLPTNDSMPDADDVFGPGTVIRHSVRPPAFRLERAQEQQPGPRPFQLNQAQDQQQSRLRELLTTLREALANSTALVNNLRTRNEVFRAENTANQAQLKQFKEGRDVVKGAVEEREMLKKLSRMVVVVGAVLVVGYAYWCWCMGPEMQYVLRRRREVLGL